MNIRIMRTRAAIFAPLAMAALFFAHPFSASAATQIFLTSGSTWTVPSDWNNAANTIECVGAGGNGSGATTGRVGGGGGGGAYAKISNLSLTPHGSVTYSVAAANSSATLANDTYFNGAASTTASLSCSGGLAASANVQGLGGTTANSTGTVEYSGNTSAISGATGGGGAGGPDGAGANGAALAGAGGGGPGSSCRHTAAAKQKPLNSTSTLPVRPISQPGRTLDSSEWAPMPLASATRPVRTQAA